jgi:hypothetical protein
VRWVGQLDEDAMGPGFEADDDDRFASRVNEVPWGFIDCDVYMTYARRHIESACPKHGNDTQVLGPVLDEDEASRQRLGERRIDDERRRRLVFDGDQLRDR